MTERTKIREFLPKRPNRVLEVAREAQRGIRFLPEEVETAWKAVERRAIRRQQTVEAVKLFSDYAALEARLASQGPESLVRVSPLSPHRGQRDIAIPMPYRLALL